MFGFGVDELRDGITSKITGSGSHQNLAAQDDKFHIIVMWLLRTLLNGLFLGFPRFLLLKMPWVVLVPWRVCSLCALQLGTAPALALWRCGEIHGGFGSIPGVPEMWSQEWFGWEGT